MVIVSSQLVLWLARRGFLGESTPYWREFVRQFGPDRTPRRVRITEWDDEVAVLRDGFQAALDARPCHLRFNSGKPARRAVAELGMMEREYDQNREKELVRSGTPPADDAGRPQVPEDPRA